MREEISAGGIVYRKKKEFFEILLLKDKGDNWTFPKGLVEKGEERSIAAKREVSEEVGLKQIELVSELSPIGYWYRWQGDLVKKTVYYFLFRVKGDEIPVPQKEEGIKDVSWFSLQKASTIIGYKKTNTAILKEVIEKLESNK